MPVRQVSLLVLWDAEFDDAVAGVEPAGGDGFGSGEEVHAFGAVGVGVAEQGGSVRDDPLIGNLGKISMRCHSVPSGSRRACRRYPALTEAWTPAAVRTMRHFASQSSVEPKADVLIPV